MYASDGFVSLSGYGHREISRMRNCRFLQGPMTEKAAVRRLKTSIANEEETVELLLNYRKDGEPFWNLLHLTPLYDIRGTLCFFLGGQVSTAMHDHAELLSVLKLRDVRESERSSLDTIDVDEPSSPTMWGALPKYGEPRVRPHFFRHWRANSKSEMKESVDIMPTPGMEKELVDKITKVSFNTRLETFQNAYSKVCETC